MADFLAKIGSSAEIKRFLHSVIDELVQNPVNYGEFENAEGFNESRNAFKKLFRDALKQTKEELKQRLSKGGISDSIGNDVVECFSAREEDLLSFFTEHASHISQSYLKDFDWKLQLAISSNKISSQREPLLLVNFSIADNVQQQQTTTKSKSSPSTNNNQKSELARSLLLELTKQDLDKLISSLQEVNEVLQEHKIYQ